MKLGGYHIVWLGLLIWVGLTACSTKGQYEKMVAQELASGIRNDSIFLGVHFGMTNTDFFAHCWELNKQKLIRQGPKNLSVEYDMGPFLKAPAKMNFYPNFEDGVIIEMPAKIAYDGWAPWNKPLSSDSLLLEVKALYEKWYGGGFMKIEDPNRGTAFVKVDGNRRISIFTDVRSVKVLFSDLTAAKYAAKQD